MSVWADVRKPLQPDEPPPEMPSVWATPEDQPVNLPSATPDVRGPRMQLSTDTANRADLNKIANHDQMVHDINALNDVRWKQEHPWGTPENHPGHLGKLAHVFSQIGNIAGNIVAPNVMARIPGTQLGMQQEAAGLENNIDTEQQHGAENAQKNAAAGNMESETETRKAELPYVAPGAESRMRLENAQAAEAEQKAASPDLATAYAHAVNDAMKNGRDPSQDPIVQHLADAITSIQKQPVPKELTADNDLKNQILAAEQAGNQPLVKKLQKQLSDLNPQGQQKISISLGNQAMSERHFNENLNRKDIANHDKAYVAPAEGTEKSYQMANMAYQEFEAARRAGKTLPTGAQSMLMLSQHLATTFGTVKGSRVTKDMIQEHLGARSIGDAAEVAINKLINGDALSPDQWQAFHQLIQQSRNESWKIATKEAARKHIPIDFLPPDLQTITKNGVQYTMGEDGQYHKAGE